MLGGNVTAKPPEHELGLADGWRFRQGRNEPESVGRRKTKHQAEQAELQQHRCPIDPARGARTHSRIDSGVDAAVNPTIVMTLGIADQLKLRRRDKPFRAQRRNFRVLLTQSSISIAMFARTRVVRPAFNLFACQVWKAGSAFSLSTAAP